MRTNNHEMHGIFPCPIYVVKRDSNLSVEEEAEIEDIIKERKHNVGEIDYRIDNFYMFGKPVREGKVAQEGRLKDLKEFCELHIDAYVKEVLNPKEENELDFFITQSWINVVEPGGNIDQHYHANSIISGAFYISTEKDDKITFSEPNIQLKEPLKIEPKEFNIWNSRIWYFPVAVNELILFPSWLGHRVDINENQTSNRISISFNVFAKGNFGIKGTLNELILK